MDKPSISVIIPTFNAGETIEATLDSLAQQSFTDFEVIIADGKSQDDTLSRVRSHRIGVQHIVSKKDKGVYEALNRGIELSRGRWLYFLGANDRVESNAFETLMSAAETRDDLLYGNVEYVNARHSKIPVLHKGRFDGQLKYRNTLHHQGTFYRSSIFADRQYDENLRVLADYDVNLYCFLSGKKARYVDSVVAICDADGLSKRFRAALYREEIEVKKKHFRGLGMLVQRIWVWMKYLYKKLP